MSYNTIDLNYELDNELLNENVSLYDRADLNKLVIAQDDGENLNHFNAKVILYYIFLSQVNTHKMQKRRMYMQMKIRSIHFHP